jgi:hypothetical protein
MDSAEQTPGICRAYRRARKKFTRTVIGPIVSVSPASPRSYSENLSYK